jgi:hypothetical protein
MSKPLAYLVLGATGSGRREVLSDLITDGFGAGEKLVCFLSDAESVSPHDTKLGDVQRWHWTPDHKIIAELPADCTTLFFITDGQVNPVEQIEAFQAWMLSVGVELGRVYCVVNCTLAHTKSASLAWYDACIHFSDIVLLNRREGVPNKWMSDFVERYRSQFYPCLFEMVKAGRIKNPAMLLEPQARRMSLAFDEHPEELFPVGLDVEVTDENGDPLDDDGGEQSPDEAEAGPLEDIYFQRRPGGRRVKEIPDIKKLLHEP